jgi:hypothetical protein
MKRLIHCSDQRVTQSLGSGLIIRQDYREATRFVMFDTGLPEWQYATHGGTLFVGVFRGMPYGLTCGHVRKDFEWKQLVVTNSRHGRAIAGLSAVFYASSPKGAAVDADILDVVVIQFSGDVTPAYFADTAFLLDDGTVGTSRSGDTLHVCGALKELSKIGETTISPRFCQLEMQDNTGFSHDPTLRSGMGQFTEPGFSSVTGLSGAPVFNVTTSRLVGMVSRATMHSNLCRMRYIDIFDILQLLSAAHEGRAETAYTKTVLRSIDRR